MSALLAAYICGASDEIAKNIGNFCEAIGTKRYKCQNTNYGKAWHSRFKTTFYVLLESSLRKEKVESARISLLYNCSLMIFYHSKISKKERGP